MAALHGDALARSGRGLTKEEQSLLWAVFGESVDLDAIRLVEARIANAPTTLGNIIRIRAGEQLPSHVLVHEAAHVWQFQTKGTAYVSDSALHQGLSILRTGSRASAYDVTIVPGQSIHDYTAEQQAMIIENQFLSEEWREHPEVRRMMDEVRTARPVPLESILQDAWFGPGGEQPSDGRPPAAPLFRIDL